MGAISESSVWWLHGELEAGKVSNSRELFQSFWLALLSEWDIYESGEEKGDKLRFDNVGLR